MNYRKLKAAGIASFYLGSIIGGVALVIAIYITNPMVLLWLLIGGFSCWFFYSLWLGLYASALLNIPEEQEKS